MEVAGVLAHAQSFPDAVVNAATIDGLELDNGTEYFWGLLVAPLRALGREEIASAIERKIRATVRRNDRIEGRDWTGGIRRFDREFLGGRLKKLRGMLRP